MFALPGDASDIDRFWIGINGCDNQTLFFCAGFLALTLPLPEPDNCSSIVGGSDLSLTRVCFTGSGAVPMAAMPAIAGSADVDVADFLPFLCFFADDFFEDEFQ